MDREPLARCEELLGYRFRNSDLLRLALTHASARGEPEWSNERLEFLGDAVLGLAVSDFLYAEYPELREGELTRIRAAIVSRQTLGSRLQATGLHAFISIGKGLAMKSRIPTSVLANVYEALVAAIYLDGGYGPASAFCLETLADDLALAARHALAHNHKSTLQHLAQRRFGVIPEYRVLQSRGPDHGKSFRIAAEIRDQRFPAAWGRSKKEAEQGAASLALNDLQQRFPDDPVFEHWVSPRIVEGDL